jgi:hypothetical protein
MKTCQLTRTKLPQKKEEEKIIMKAMTMAMTLIKKLFPLHLKEISLTEKNMWVNQYLTCGQKHQNLGRHGKN